MIKFFKIIALLEGISLLALFSNMLFIKPSNFDLYKSFLFPIGMSHGILFIAYIAFAVLFKFENKYSFKTFFIISLASFIPFGTFYIEKKYLNKLQ